MKPLEEHQIRQLLKGADGAPAPADMAAKLHAEIPDADELRRLAVPTVDESAAGDGSARPMSATTRRVLLWAATVVVAVGGLYLAYRPELAVSPEAREEFFTLEESRLQEENLPSVPALALPASPSQVAPPAADPTPAERAVGAPARQPPTRPRTRGSTPPPARPISRAPIVEAEAEGVTETLTVTSESPLLDERRIVKGQRVPIPDPTPDEQRQLQALGYASATPHEGRINVGGNVSGEIPKVVVAAPAPEDVTASIFFEPPAPGAPPPSTGGTVEPNGAPYGDVFFRGYGVNPFVDTEDDALSTFGLDVDTASYTIARRFLRDGHLPPPDAIRVEELVNYFDYRDPPPSRGDFALYAEGAPSPYPSGERYYLLRLALRGRDIAATARPPATLVFVVDISGSMARENRLGLVQRALGLLLDELRADDRVALVVYGTNGRVVLEPTSDKEAIRRAIDGLRSEGATNAEEGLRLGYELAAAEERPGVLRRVILCSDGVANVGESDALEILERIRRYTEQGVELTTVGFGMGNYNDVLMERLANQGDGRYAYVDELDEARRVFVRDLTGTLQTIAGEAKAQVEFEPSLVSRYRLLGYENRDIADERFRDDTVDAGEIGAGHTVTALYEIKLNRPLKRRDKLATLRLRYASTKRGEVVEDELVVRGRDLAPSWAEASTSWRLAALVGELAEILKQTFWARDADSGDVFRRLQAVAAERPGDRELAELVELAARVAEYRAVAEER